MKRNPCIAMIAVLALAAAAAWAAPQPGGLSAKEMRLIDLHAKGQALYAQGDLAGARALFEEMLLIDPNDLRAQTYLDNTRAEWEAFQAEQAAQKEMRQKADATEALLAVPVTIETKLPMDISQFLGTLSLASGLDFNVAPGVEANVFGKFIDTRLDDVLDATLPPIGLKWGFDKGIVTVEPNLQTRVFLLSPSELQKVKTLYDENVLQTLLWGGEGTPQLSGERMVLDERRGQLIATDSASRLIKLAALIQDLDQAVAPGLATRFYRVDPSIAPKIKALIDSVIQTKSDTPFGYERKVYIQGGNLIIRETPDQLAKIEELLRNQRFTDRYISDQLQISTFSLIPRDPLLADEESIAHLKEEIVPRMIEQVELYLYTPEGKAAARAEGRSMWYDPNTLNLVIVDTAKRLSDVKDFINALPYYQSQERFKIVEIQYVDVGEFEGQLLQILGREGAEDTGGADTGLQTTITIRREGETTWRDLTIICRRVTAGGDDLSDSVELLVRIRGGDSQSFTLTELSDTQRMQDRMGGEYEFYAEDVKPSGTAGEGRARIQIVYNPPATAM